MKIKFNWGTGIAIAIAVFLGGMAWLVYLCTTVDYSLVEKDYYPKGIEYQTRIDQIKNTATFRDQLELKWADNSLLIRFPREVAQKIDSGTIYLYRPSDPGLDRYIRMAFDSTGLQVVGNQKFHSGKYIVKLEWKGNSKSYYYEQSVLIP